MKKFLAIDLGASSGRGIIGEFDGEKLSLPLSNTRNILYPRSSCRNTLSSPTKILKNSSQTGSDGLKNTANTTGAKILTPFSRKCSSITNLPSKKTRQPS